MGKTDREILVDALLEIIKSANRIVDPAEYLSHVHHIASKALADVGQKGEE